MNSMHSCASISTLRVAPTLPRPLCRSSASRLVHAHAGPFPPVPPSTAYRWQLRSPHLGWPARPGTSVRAAGRGSNSTSEGERVAPAGTSTSSDLPSWLNLTTSSILAVAIFLSGLGAGNRLAVWQLQSAQTQEQQQEAGAAAAPEAAMPHGPGINPKQPPVVMDEQELSPEEVGEARCKLHPLCRLHLPLPQPAAPAQARSVLWPCHQCLHAAC